MILHLHLAENPVKGVPSDENQTVLIMPLQDNENRLEKIATDLREEKYTYTTAHLLHGDQSKTNHHHPMRTSLLHHAVDT